MLPPKQLLSIMRVVSSPQTLIKDELMCRNWMLSLLEVRVIGFISWHNGSDIFLSPFLSTPKLGPPKILCAHSRCRGRLREAKMLESTHQCGQQCPSNSCLAEIRCASPRTSSEAPVVLCDSSLPSFSHSKILPERTENTLMPLFNTLTARNVYAQHISNLQVLENLTFCLISSSILTGEPSSATCLTPSLAKPPYSHST